MRCTACGTELIAGKRFCHACGARVALTCRGCGATVSPDFRFCPDCGLEIGSAGVHDAPPPATDDALARLSRHIPETLADKIRTAQHTIARDLSMPYMQNWNLGIEHQLTQSLLLEINYQGAKGTHLSSFLGTYDPPPGPGDPNPRRPFPVGGTPMRRALSVSCI